MARWTDMDSDAERLPPGFERIGYDADTQTYTFRDANGAIYESSSGNRYGELRATGERHSFDSEAEAETQLVQNEVVEKGDGGSVRMMMPFALIVLVVLFLMFRLLHRSGGGGASGGGVEGVNCGEGYQRVEIRPGDTCWAIAKVRGVRVEELLRIQGNEGLQCERLRIGQGVCVPS